MNLLRIKKTNYIQKELFFLLLILYRPEYVLLNSVITTIVNGLRILVTIYLLVKLFTYKKKLTFIILPFFIWGGFNVYCIFNGTWEFANLIEYLIILDVFALVVIYLPVHSRDLYVALSRLLLIYGICNTITIFMGNAYENLFLGFDNDIIMRIIPLLGVELYLSFSIHNKLVTFDSVICLIYFIDYLITFSASGVLTLVILFFMVYSKTLSFRYINSRNCVFATMLLWVGLYVFKIQKYLFLLLGVLKKDLTLSYRTYIWESVLVAIKESPLIGYGNIINNKIYYSIVYPIYYASVVPHNFYLYIVASSGIVGLFIIISFIIRSFKPVDGKYYLKSNKVLIASLFAYLLCGIVASYYAIEYLAFLIAVAASVKYDNNKYK